MFVLADLKKKIKNSSFLKNVITLMSGSLLAQIIPILASLVLARLYSAEDFGLLSIFNSIIGFVAIVITGRYEVAIMLANTNHKALNVSALSLLIGFAISLISLIAILIYSFSGYSFSIIEMLPSYILYFLPVIFFINAIYLVSYYWLTRSGKIKEIALIRVFQASASSGAQIIFPLLGVGLGLILGNILGLFVMVYFYIINVFFKTNFDIKKMKFSSIKEVAIEYKEFPLVNSFQMLSNAIKLNGVVFVIASFFNNAVLGNYAMVTRVVTLPLQVFSSSLGQLAHQEISKLKNDEKTISPFIIKIVKNLVFISLPMFLLLFFMAPALFGFVFGEEWRVAGQYLQLVLPYEFLQFCIVPMTVLPLLLNKQKKNFILSLGANLAFVFSFVLFKDKGFETSLAVASGTQVIYFLYLIYWYSSLIRKYESSL